MRIRSETGLPVKKKTSVLCAFCFEDTNIAIGLGVYLITGIYIPLIIGIIFYIFVLIFYYMSSIQNIPVSSLARSDIISKLQGGSKVRLTLTLVTFSMADIFKRISSAR